MVSATPTLSKGGYVKQGEQFPALRGAYSPRSGEHTPSKPSGAVRGAYKVFPLKGSIANQCQPYMLGTTYLVAHTSIAESINRSINHSTYTDTSSKP